MKLDGKWRKVDTGILNWMGNGRNMEIGKEKWIRGKWIREFEYGNRKGEMDKKKVETGIL